MKKVVLLNTAIVTNLGKFEVKEISLEEAKKLVKKNDFVFIINNFLVLLLKKSKI